VRRLEGADARHLQGLSPDSEWISATWGGASSLAASAAAWGAFIDGTLVSVAVPFFVGDRYEDLGVVTEAPYRGRGLSVACAARLAEEILGRGRAASWSTSPDNLPSLRVAEKVGFEKVRDDRLFVVGQPIPGVARRGAA
jgi:predicted GNAT family acetyltransferase